jgi:hypothetical protein
MTHLWKIIKMVVGFLFGWLILKSSYVFMSAKTDCLALPEYKASVVKNHTKKSILHTTICSCKLSLALLVHYVLPLNQTIHVSYNSMLPHNFLCLIHYNYHKPINYIKMSPSDDDWTMSKFRHITLQWNYGLVLNDLPKFYCFSKVLHDRRVTVHVKF